LIFILKAVIQRVNKCSVLVEKRVVGSIDKGILVLLGVFSNDTENDVDYMVNKISNLRIFNSDDAERSLLDCNLAVLVVSQFTLCADISKGRRPSFHRSASPKLAKHLYMKLIEQLKNCKIKTEAGEFGAMMNLKIENWGPYTLVLDSKE